MYKSSAIFFIKLRIMGLWTTKISWLVNVVGYKRTKNREKVNNISEPSNVNKGKPRDCGNRHDNSI
jgi:hypothetical protein